MTSTRTQPPAWLLEPSKVTAWAAPEQQGSLGRTRGRRRAGGFLDKTLADSAEVMRQAMYAEPGPGRTAGLASIDPRVKLIGLVVLLIAVSLVHSPRTLALSYAAVVVMAWAGGIPMRPFVRRVWLVVPLFTAIAVLPATLSVVTPGELVLPLWTWHGTVHGVTAAGLLAATGIILRVACSVSLVLLVTLSTPWNRLLGALGALGVPRIFVTIVAMAYRYLFVLLGAITDLLMARKARTITPGRHDRAARSFTGAAVGTTLGKSHQLAEEVHQAMLARGYAGRHPSLRPQAIRALDGVVLAAVLAAAVSLVGVDRVWG